MKITFLIASVMCSAILLSCSKSQSALTTKDKLLGKWKVDSISSKEFTNGIPGNSPTEIGKPGEYAQFNNDGKYYLYINGFSQTGTYSIINDTSMAMYQASDTFNLRIRELTKTKLYLYSKKQISGDTIYLEDKYFFYK